jgi:putative DNA primase/helicase
MIHGPTPLFWVDKWISGAGGTLLSSVIALPSLGFEPAGITAPRDQAEWNRVILSTLLRSPHVFFIDNCNKYLSSEALAHAITATRYEGRVIGSSRNESAEVSCLWLINGIELHFGFELTRRLVRIRIQPHVADAEQPDGPTFLHPDIIGWMIENRTMVIYHILVLVQAWRSRGCPGPAAATPEFGSFSAWREVAGGILNTAGISGFLLNLEEAQREADQDSATLRAFMEAWREEHGPAPVFSTELLPIARRFFELPPEDLPASIRLGLILSKAENQTHGDLQIRSGSESKGKTPWRLQSIPEGSK